VNRHKETENHMNQMKYFDVLIDVIMAILASILRRVAL